MNVVAIRPSVDAPVESALDRMLRRSRTRARIAERLLAGDGDKEIARAVGLARFTVRDHLLLMRTAAGARNRVHLAAILARRGGLE